MFRMAAYNVGDNLKETVTEEHISTVLRGSLEEVRLILFNTFPNRIECTEVMLWAIWYQLYDLENVKNAN